MISLSYLELPNTIYYQCHSQAFLTQQTYETFNIVLVSKEHSCLLPTDVSEYIVDTVVRQGEMARLS